MPVKFLLVIALVSLPMAVSASGDGLSDQQRDFLAAREAIKKGHLDAYRRLAGSLHDYPLVPYLQYEYLRKYLSKADRNEVLQFLRDYPDVPLSALLRRAWLERLAGQGRWAEFLEDYDGDPDTELRCHVVTARQRTGAEAARWDDVEALWLAGVSQPDACNPAFAAWRKAGKMTRDHVIERVGLAMERGQLRLVSYLSTFLDSRDRAWVARWQRMHRKPSRELKRLNPTREPQWAARLFSHGVRRLAREDAIAADALWRRTRSDYALNSEQIDDTERAIALHLAYQRDAVATSRLAELAERIDDPQLRQWRIRSALWHRDWEAVLAALKALPAEERLESDWMYWRGRALDALGRAQEAQAYFEAAAQCRCYYGFLAAERAGRPPAIDSVPLQIDAGELERMAQEPAAIRAKELHALGLASDARREWRDFIESMDSDRLQTAAKLADSWGWHDQAILTLGRTDTLSDLELRFPTPFQEHVMAASEQRELDTAFVYAVMRQESAFNTDARSPVGALGLMQLMPATARRTARQFKYPVPKTYDLLSATNNINLGTAHLRHLLNKYEGNRLYTMAAYNAGPHRVSRWLPKDESMPADIWIASMPFDETRNYVKRILAYTLIYEWRLGREPTPMSSHLQAIEPYSNLARKISMNRRTQ